MAVFNLTCLNQNDFRTDTDTGCRYCIFGEKTEYEACRQSYYLKKQSEIMQQSSQQSVTSANNNQKIDTLKSSNTDLQKIVEQQNQQITQLIQSSEQSTHKIENLNLINTILIVALVIIACAFLAIKFMKRKGASQ